MAKCSECGFLAVWDVREHEFIDADEHCRASGFPEGYTQNLYAYKVKCFIQKYDLGKEVLAGDYVVNLKDTVRQVITSPRTCDGFTPWIQGFHPKERREMMLQDELRKEQRWHANLSLGVALLGTLTVAAITYLSANLGANATRDSAKSQIEAQYKIAQMQIEAQREIAKIEASKPVPPINVVVQMAEPATNKKLEKK